MRVMPVRTMPENGDVVIRERVRDGRRVFTMHTVPGPEQCVLRSRDDAVRQAALFAKRERVRVWSTDDGAGFVLLEDFRAAHLVSGDKGSRWHERTQRSEPRRMSGHPSRGSFNKQP